MEHIIYDIETGKITESPLPKQLAKELEQVKIEHEARIAEITAREEQKNAAKSKLLALGLTNDEVEIMLGEK